MKIGTIPKAALLCSALLGFTVPCPASEAPTGATDSVRKVQQEEAVIISIDQNKVTLQSVADTSKLTTITTGSATDLKVGDRVTVIGTTLKKSEVPPPQHFKGGDTSPSSSASPTPGNKS